MSCSYCPVEELVERRGQSDCANLSPDNCHRQTDRKLDCLNIVSISSVQTTNFDSPGITPFSTKKLHVSFFFSCLFVFQVKIRGNQTVLWPQQLRCYGEGLWLGFSGFKIHLKPHLCILSRCAYNLTFANKYLSIDNK